MPLATYQQHSQIKSNYNNPDKSKGASAGTFKVEESELNFFSALFKALAARQSMFYIT